MRSLAKPGSICGEPVLHDGSADERRFQWSVLVFFCDGVYGWYLDFYGSYAFLNAGSRAYGLLVRCVQEFAWIQSGLGLLPVCGVVPPGVGSVCECRFLWLLLVVVRFDAVFLVVGIPGGVRLRAREQSFARLCGALCPSVYDLFRETFPSAGFRSSDAGVVAGVGSQGVIWSFALSGGDGSRLVFLGSYSCLSAVNRTFGFGLRCVQEVTWMVFLPVCGFSGHHDGSADGYRFRRPCLVFVAFGDELWPAVL